MSKQWQRLARRHQVAINAAWWLRFFLPSFVGLNLVACVVIILIRRYGAEPNWGLYSYAVASGCLLAISYFLAKKHFESQQEAMVRLEHRYKLRGHLLAATEGRADWPALPPSTPLLVRAEWRRLLLPALLSVALLAAGWALPIGQAQADPDPYTVEPPQDWAQSEQWLQTLEQTDLFELGALEKFNEQLAALRDQPPEQWYQDGSREASDSLQRAIQEASEHSALELARARKSLERLAEDSDMLSDGERRALEAHLQATLENMQSGLMPLKKDMADQIANLDYQQLQNLSQEQLQSMCENMQKGAQECAYIAGISDEQLTQMMEMQQRPAGGEPARGPGHEDLLFGVLSPEQNAQMEGVSNRSTENAALGDLLEVRESMANQQTKPFRGATTGGGQAVTGTETADAVWKVRLTPEEKALVEDYF